MNCVLFYVEIIRKILFLKINTVTLEKQWSTYNIKYLTEIDILHWKDKVIDII